VCLSERDSCQYLARQLVHRGVPPGRHQRDSPRALRGGAPRVQESLATLLAGDGPIAEAVHRARHLSVPHHRLRRPGQRLAADGGAHRLPGRRHPRLLAGHQGGTIRARGRAVVDARPCPAGDAARPVSDLRRSGGDARMNPRPWWRKLGHGSLLVLATVYCVFPIYFMLVQSLKSAHEDVFGNPLIVTSPTFENFEELFERKGDVRGFVGRALRRSYPFLDWLENTVIVFAGAVTVTLATGVLAAYAIGRLRPPGFRWWRRLIFATYVIPHTILFVPLYQVIIRLHLDDNLLTLLLVYPTLALPFCIWVLSAYFQHLSREIEEAALIEGASRAAAFFRIILPMSRPVIVASGIFTLGTIASDFMLASVFLLSAHNQTIPAGLATMEVALDELLAVAGINLM